MPKNYVDNKKFTEDVIKYVASVNKALELKQPRPRMNNYIGSCIYEIATHLAYKPNFINYTYRDEMVGDGIECCVKYIHNFNSEKSRNAFSYVTQIIFYAFLRRIKKEKKQQYIKYKLFEREGIHNIMGEEYSRSAEFLEKYNSSEEYLRKELQLTEKDIDDYDRQIKGGNIPPKGLEYFYSEDDTSDNSDIS